MTLPTRKDLVTALRSAGLSNRQARALLKGGLPEVIGEEAAENQLLQERIEQLEQVLRTAAGSV
jgi:DNA-binding transcriptional MerR regulator